MSLIHIFPGDVPVLLPAQQTEQPPPARQHQRADPAALYVHLQILHESKAAAVSHPDNLFPTQLRNSGTHAAAPFPIPISYGGKGGGMSGLSVEVGIFSAEEPVILQGLVVLDQGGVAIVLQVAVCRTQRVPVSYTHLDVYKRQFFICASRAFIAFWSCCAVSFPVLM